MAKWGEGDPRWIVEDRPDATNVNNWHWTEKNASQWSKDKIKSLFTDLVLEDPSIGKVTITEVNHIEGEASANNRKAKLIFFYEWDIKMDWKGHVHNNDKEEITGKIEIPNLSEENKPEDVDFIVSCSSSSSDGDKLKEMIRLKAVKRLREMIDTYIKDLREEFSVGMVLPKKEDQDSDSKSITVAPKHHPSKTEKGKVSSSVEVQKGKSGGTQISTVKLKLKQTFKCTAEEIYNALTIVEMVQAFTQGPCKVEARKGGRFEMFGSNIHGEFLELIPGKRIKQTWRFKSWPDGHFSEVLLEIDQKEDSTEVRLTQTGVPVSNLDQTRDGWNHYYFESLKKTFGFGALLI